MESINITSYRAAEMLESFNGFFTQMQLYRAAIKEITTKLEILDEQYSVTYERSPIHQVESRLKSPISILTKLEKRGLALSLESIHKNLHDVAGIRVVCNYIDDVYRVEQMLLGQTDIELVEKRDYIKNPKPNGYRSLHLIVRIPIFLADSVESVLAEIQIRTIAMDFWASLEHELRYKSEGAVDDSFAARLLNCANTISNLDVEMQKLYHDISERYDADAKGDL